MASIVSTLLDSLLILLIIVFVFVATRRLIFPKENAKTAAQENDEGIIARLIDERSRIQENQIAANGALLKGKITEKQFRELQKANLIQLKNVERELKQKGVF